MATDKNLFLYDLAVVTIMKNEALYVKEWIEYYLLAGVKHFYIYDNGSTDNFKEVLQPYIEHEIVTYIFFPGKAMQQPAFNDAVQKYRFFCRYMAFIDADEFILPQNTDRSIVEVVDEILEGKEPAGGLAIQWLFFGSNYQDNADYSRGVIERFTRHRKEIANSIKTIANPRRVDYLFTPHYMTYFDGFFQIDETSLKMFPNSDYKIQDKFILNHYYCKSREEFAKKVGRGDTAYGREGWYNVENFSHEPDNDVEDDSILKYRASRIRMGGGIIYPTNYQKCYSALIQNLSMVFTKNTPAQDFQGKVETFLTCRKLAEQLRENFLDEDTFKFFEEASLKAVYRTLNTNLTLGEAQLLLSELPNILPLNYPIIETIYKHCVDILAQIKDVVRKQINDPKKMLKWKDFTQYDYLMRMLESFNYYEHKN